MKFSKRLLAVLALTLALFSIDQARAAATIGSVKRVMSPVRQTDGSYNVQYQVVVFNMGTEALNNVQITDALTATITAPATFSVVGVPTTTGTLAPNTLFNGTSNINLLNAATSTLPIAGYDTVKFTINIVPNGNFGIFNNIATATATGAVSAANTTDITNDTNSPDPDGDGNPNETGENNPVPLTLIPNPVLGIAKSVTSSVLQPDGSFHVTYLFTLKNMGNVDVNNVQITDDLTALVGSPSSFSVVGSPTAGGTLSANPSFNGNTNKNILNSASSSVAKGATLTASVVVKIWPNGFFGPFNNLANVSCTSSVGGSITYGDISDSGTNPDTDADNEPNEPGENDPTPVTLAPTFANIGLTKQVLSQTTLADGSTNVTFLITLKNFGNVGITNLQVVENLVPAFPAPATWTLVGAPVGSAGLSINSAFDGNTNTNMLNGGLSTMGVPDSKTIQFTVNIKNGGVAATYSNTCSVSGTGMMAGGAVADVSNNGTNPDTDGDFNTNEAVDNVPTPIIINAITPKAGLSKVATVSPVAADGSYIVDYTIKIENLGSVGLTNIQVTDNLAATFAAPATFTVIGTPVVSGGLSANPAFNGTTTTTLLNSGTSSLSTGQSGTILFKVQVNPLTSTGPYNNSATVTANGPAGLGSTTDISDNSMISDTDGDGNPNEVGENDPTPVVLGNYNAIGIAKSYGPAVLLPDNSYNIPVTVTLKNLGNTTLTNVSAVDNLALAFPAPLTFSIPVLPAATGTLFSNPLYNGTTNLNLLNPGSVLAPGQTEKIFVTINVKLNGGSGTFNNTAVATGTGPGSTVVTDNSDNGTLVDANGNGNANEAGENDVTPITLPGLSPAIGLSKKASTPVQQPDGSFNTTVTLVVKNIGSVKLENVQVSDNLSLAIPSPAIYTISMGPVASGTIAVNTAFNGITNLNLLNSSLSSLLPGQSGTINFTLNVKTMGVTGPFINSASASATGPGGVGSTNDVSDDGDQPDANNNGNAGETGENDPTVFNFVASPVMGVAKMAGSPALQVDGSYNVPFTVTVKNLGSVKLENIQVNDNLSAQFGAPVTYTLVAGPFATGGLSANSAFNGSTTTNLLSAGSSSLGLMQSGTVHYTLNVKTGSAAGPFSNNAVGTATGPSGVGTTSDISDDGSDPDANGNGNPLEVSENDPTRVSFNQTDRIGLAKKVTNITTGAGSSYNVTFQYTLQNLGTTKLTGIKLEDFLNITFPLPSTFSVTGAPSVTGNLVANTLYNGSSISNMLNSSSYLLPGQTSTVNVTVNVIPGGSIYYNTATVTALGSSSYTVTDISDNGWVTDANGNGIASDNDENDPTPVLIPDNRPVIGVAKKAGIPVLQGDGSYDMPVTVTVQNLGLVNLTGVSVYENLSACFVSPTTTYTLVGGVSASGTLSASLVFNGSTLTDLLNPTLSTLAVGATATITYTVKFKPAGFSGPYVNQVQAVATGAGSSTSDLSDDGTITDANGNGISDEDGENDPTVIFAAPRPVIGVAKTTGTITLQTDGTYLVPFTVTVKNLGNVAVDNVQVKDNLNTVIFAPYSYAMASAPTVTGTLAANSAFNGSTNPDLLNSSSSSLAIGETATISFSIKVNLNGATGTFANNAYASATGLAGSGSAGDVSDNGTNVDANNNGNGSEHGENDPTVFTIAPTPIIGVAKSASAPVKQTNGSYNIAYKITVKNLGNVKLNSVQVTENLKATFPAPATFTVISGPTAGGILNISSAFDGETNINMLNAGTTSLNAGQTDTIRFTVNVKTGTDSTVTYRNQVNASAVGNASTGNTSDISVSGLNPDPNGNLNPGEAGENTTTDVTIERTVLGDAMIGVAKAANAPVDRGDGTFEVNYVITVKNMGTAALSNIKVFENLRRTFPAPTEFSLAGTPSVTGDLVANTSFNGTTDTNLVASTSKLKIGESGAISLTVIITPNSRFGPFKNRVKAYGSNASLASQTASDYSTDGSNPDPNGNGNPSDEGEDLSTDIVLKGIFIANGFSPNGDGINDKFEISGIESYPGAEISIFNRWGNKVFEKTAYDNSWDGTSDGGGKVQSGTYFYVLDLKDGSPAMKGYIVIKY